MIKTQILKEKFSEDLLQQQSVYSEITSEQELVSKRGLQPNVNVLNGEQGVLLALNYDKRVNEILEKVSQTISEIVPSVVYTRNDFHTTIISKKYTKLGEKDILLNNFKAIASHIKVKKLQPVIYFFKWLYNSNSLLLAGKADLNMYGIVDDILNSKSGKILDLKMPIMNHITVSRFTQSVDTEKLNSLLTYINNLEALGFVPAKSLVIASFKINKKHFQLHIYEEHKFHKV